VNPTYFRWLRLAVFSAFGLLLAGLFALACTFVYIAPALPTAESMHKVELAVPLRVYTRTGELISQIGEQRRIPVKFEDIPLQVRQAVLAAEDDRFFEHSGFDWMGITRSIVMNLATADVAGQGGSTITQQAARNMFLSLDKTLRRKLSEVFVTYRMEKDFTKEQILATYLNVILFGQRSYGIAAAAETYYGKRLDELTVAQAATLAGIIQLPSRQNPVTNPKAAEARRAYVLRRMHELGYIDEATAAQAAKEPVVVATRGFAPLTDVEAAYVAELTRQDLIARFGKNAVNAGYKVFTTIDGRLQVAANNALRLGLMEYDRRHGYRGRLGEIELGGAPTPEELEAGLEKFETVSLLQPAVVTVVAETSIEVYVRGEGPAKINWDGLSWARKAVKGGVGANPRKAADIVSRGDVVYVISDRRGSAQLGQLPQAQAALVALDPNDGAVVAMVGGFSFHSNAFNRVTQARRQPGSGFKPFLYSAALDNGFTPASVILDMPVVQEDGDSEETWRPENFGGEFRGPTRLREALVRSQNLVSIRILQSIGFDAAINHAAKFGFDPKSLPRVLSLALGVQSVSPLQMATGFAVFANGGFKVDPYYITRIEDSSGQVVFEAAPMVVCAACEKEPSGSASQPDAEHRAPRVISAQNAWLMSDIMHDVATRGTAVRTQQLGRDDLAGKTGTSQLGRDNWFNGFNHNLVASVWVGYDDDRSLGEREEGSSTAVPLWNLFMREALKGTPSSRLERPEGLVDVRVSSRTGAPVEAGDPDAIVETFMVEHQPGMMDTDEQALPGAPVIEGRPKPESASGKEPLF
jgi:penicillin-binding protein 1A